MVINLYKCSFRTNQEAGVIDLCLLFYLIAIRTLSVSADMINLNTDVNP